MDNQRTAQQKARQYRASRRASTGAQPMDMANRRAVIYARVSVARGEETTTGQQVKECEAWCKRNGVDVVDVFVDTGESAFADKAPRPQFRKSLDMVKSHAANTLVVYKLDRFMRDASSAIRVRDEIHSWSGSVVSATEGVDTAETVGGTASLIFGILAWLAEMESQTKSDRMRLWHNGRYVRDDGSKALPPTGPRPYGYARQGKKEKATLVMVEDEARIIHDCARRILDDGATVTALAKEYGLTRRALKYVLTNETTNGKRNDGMTAHEGNWPAILDDATFARLIARLDDPSRMTNGTAERKHVLAGLMTCAECGSVMRSRFHKQGTRYQCVNDAGGCYNGINASAAEAAIVEYIFNAIKRDKWDAMKNAGRAFDPAVVEKLQGKLKVITHLYATTPMTDEEYNDGRAAILEQIRNAQESEPLDLPDVDDVEAAWPTMDIDGKRLIINAAFESITVGAWVRGMEPKERIDIVEN